LTLVAFYYHPELDVARARLELGWAGVRTAGAWPNPTVGVDLEKVTNPTPGISPWVYGLSLSVPIDTLWKRGYRIEQAERLGDQARLELGLAGWRVRSRLRAALADHLLARRELELRQMEESARAEVAQAQRRRLAAGAIFRLDVTRSEGELAASRAAIHAAEGQVDESRAALSSALGLPLSATKGATFVWAELEKPPPAGDLPLPELENTGRLNRLDLRALQAEYEASVAALKLEYAKRYPDLAIAPGFLNDQGDRKVTLGLTFTLPILDQNQGPIAEAEARRREVAARFLALEAQALGDIEASHARYRHALAEMEETEKTIASLRQEEAATRRAVEVGAEDRVALVGLRLSTVVGLESELQALRKAQAALGLLEDSVQRPLAGALRLPELGPESPRKKEGREGDHP
jgi:outer membrane protein TolC